MTSYDAVASSYEVLCSWYAREIEGFLFIPLDCHMAHCMENSSNFLATVSIRSVETFKKQMDTSRDVVTTLFDVRTTSCAD